MKIRFIYGRDGRDGDTFYRAHRANTGRTAAVLVQPLSNGYRLEMDRSGTRIEMTDAVIAAIAAKCRGDIGPKPKPTKWGTTLNQGSHTAFSVPIPKGSLEEWKEFLSSLLTKPESWVCLPVEKVTRQKNASIREEIREEKKEARLRQELMEQIIATGYKVLATKLHPDKGGSHEAMSNLNRAHTILKGAV